MTERNKRKFEKKIGKKLRRIQRNTGNGMETKQKGIMEMKTILVYDGLTLCSIFKGLNN